MGYSAEEVIKRLEQMERNKLTNAKSVPVYKSGQNKQFS